MGVLSWRTNALFSLVSQCKTDFEWFLQLFSRVLSSVLIQRQECNGSSNMSFLNFFSVFSSSSNQEPCLHSWPLPLIVIQFPVVFTLKLVIVSLIYCFPTTVIYIPDSSVCDLVLFSIKTQLFRQSPFYHLSWMILQDWLFLYHYLYLHQFLCHQHIFLAFVSCSSLTEMVPGIEQKCLCRIFMRWGFFPVFCFTLNCTSKPAFNPFHIYCLEFI